MPLPELKPEVIEKLIRMGRPPSILDDAFTERVLKQMAEQSPTRRSRKHSALAKSDLAKLKYSMLIQIIKKEPKPKPFYSMEVTMVNRQQIENELLKEKLLELAEGKIKVTDLGRRFVREFERAEKTGK